MNEELLSIGAELRKAREERALTLHEVEIQTKIREKFLEALENGELSEMPSNAHARGFLRNYVQFLYLDVTEFVARFNAAIGMESKELTTLTAVPDPQESAFSKESFDAENEGSPPRRQRRSTFIQPEQRQGPGAPKLPIQSRDEESPSILDRIFRQSEEPVSDEEPVGSVESAPIEDAGSSGTLREVLRSPYFTIGAFVFVGLILVIWITVTLSRLDVGELVPTPQQSEILDRYEGDATEEPGNLPTLTATEPVPASESSSQIFDRIVLTINVQSRSWVKVTVDGVVEYEGQAEAGLVLQYEGSISIIVVTGNAGGLDITYNGQKLGLMGERGAVQEEIFTVSGAVTPTPSPTATATSTQVPTATPGP